MNDPVTNVEIEDVLSSIRRLVSEDARVRPLGWRPNQAEPEAAEAPSSPAPDAGRLVLTPALRVNEQAQPAAEEVSALAVDAPSVTEEPLRDVPDESASNHMRDDESESFVVDAHDTLDSEAETLVSLADDPSDQPEPIVADAAPDEDAQDHAEAEPDTFGLAGDTDEAIVWEDHHADADDDSAPYRDMPHEETDDLTDILEDSTAPMAEGSVSDSDPQGSGFVFASTRDGSSRDSASSTLDEMYTGDDDAVDDRSFLLSEDETVLDEETLREMVTEIVRQELQGALGERITRNVRKLVRREIHRAMTSHELE